MTAGSATSTDITPLPMPQRRVEHCMGTVFTIDVRAPGCDPRVVDQIVQWLHWVDATFSTYRPDSEISRLRRGEIDLRDCTAEVPAILSRCRELEAETAGYFSAYASGSLDPSGLVKGWAIQRACEMLSAAGSTSHCVNGGGDAQCVGAPAADAQWRVGIADPLAAGQIAGIVSGTEIAVATSGTAERGSHILDPRTGARPVEIASVTLIGRELGTTDAYATAAFAMGNDAPAWIERLEAHDGFIVFADGRRWASRRLQ